MKVNSLIICFVKYYTQIYVYSIYDKLLKINNYLSCIKIIIIKNKKKVLFKEEYNIFLRPTH